MLGYHAPELIDLPAAARLLAPGEGDRLQAEMQKLCGSEIVTELTPNGSLSALSGLCTHAASQPGSQL